ncbi:3-oxosteroid 1-dehydrogenase [compost metagenome]
MKLVPGSLGTFAGLRTDAMARVLDDDGQAIGGLFAVGNDMASVMDGHYPSGGITLGPGMTFGYLAGRALAGLRLATDAHRPLAIANPCSG